MTEICYLIYESISKGFQTMLHFLLVYKSMIGQDDTSLLDLQARVLKRIMK